MNDCSKDKTEEVIKKWILRNKDIKVIYSKNKKNSWCSWTYHNASNLANWKYITFLDADDFLIKESFIDKIKLFQENPELKIVYGNCYTYNKKKWYLANFQWDLWSRLNKPIDKLREYFYVCNPLCSISTSIIDLWFFRKIWWFDPNIQINDRVLNIKIMENIKSLNEISVYNVPCFAYRMNDGNMTKNIDNMLKEQCAIINKYIIDNYKNDTFSNCYYKASLWFLRYWKYKKAFNYIKLSLQKKFSIKRLFVFILYAIAPLNIIDNIPSDMKNKIFSILRLW